ncbi:MULTISPECIES: MFS transporter [unclassified Streptomyces]|uniref:MFS transporter n=1 Tax=unclassified Streptomyces TaxID=2593676 RepID=UPI0016607F7A|nr:MULTISPECIES: MFS transporter [unclassified Streptomyces]MBD0712359.1 MFS transporter [Streptomyces sp. CBMA291]MBD0716733.1 MFS transporter [Streptomyces sp. CBMA370]
MTQLDETQPRTRKQDRFPLAGLLALATAGFITLLTETLPAGVLPAMSRDLGVTESAVGQTVTVYAIGSVIAAVPLTKATMGWPRRRLLLLAIAGFAVANTVTAISDNYVLTLGSRLLAGVVSGLLWAILAGYATRMVPAHQRGRAMAVAMAGAPIALSIGVPAGAFLARVLQWRIAFGIMTALTLLLIVWVLAAVPDFPGQGKEERLPLARTFRIPGVAPILFVTLVYVLAHSLLYTYIAPILDRLGMDGQVDAVLLTFGLLSLVSIWVTGALIDRRLRVLMITSCALFAAAVLLLGLVTDAPVLVYVSAAVWGLAFGGAATLLQTASAEAAGEAGDVAQSLIVTCWNLGIAAGGLFGGLLLGTTGASWLPWTALVLLAAALTATVGARAHGFPARSLNG